jgi:hypothetical protein
MANSKGMMNNKVEQYGTLILSFCTVVDGLMEVYQNPQGSMFDPIE